jgi:CDP-6-deoxy-D-xylo-4-hexulose-3-dehydrase
MDRKEELLDAVKSSVENYCNYAHDHSFDPRSPVVRLHEPTFGASEINAAVECLLTTQVTMGVKVRNFEREFSDYHNFRHGVMVNSGSSANLLAIATLVNVETEDCLKPGDEVIVPALSWSTTVWPLVQSGLVPVIVDIDPETLNIDPTEIEKAIGPRTRAIMIVPVYGNPCDMETILEICNRKQLVLIEDCCEALGATYAGKPVGKFGRVGTYSFYYSHHMTTLEGGICVTDDTTFAENMRIIRAHGWLREVEDKSPWLEKYPGIDERFLFVNLGFNLRATELQGAMGSVQLPKLNSFVEARRQNANWYRKEFSRFEDLFEFQKETPNGEHSWFGFPMKVRADAPFTVNELREALAEAHIESRPIICGNIAQQPAMKLYNHRVVGDLANATNVMLRGFSFGNHQAIDLAAKEYVSQSLQDFIDSKS